MCSFQRLLLLLSSFSCLACAQSRMCGTMDAHLNRVQYWEITIPEEDCVFFPSSTCTLYVSFCGRVPLDLCNNNELGPTSACVTDGTTGHSLGEYNDDPFLQTPDKLIANFDNGSHSFCPNKAITTNITFDCGPYSDWDPAQDNDASYFFKSLTVDFKNLCSVTINVLYDRVCPEAACEAKGHDIGPLISPDHWKVAVVPEQCESFFGNNKTCTLYLSFCEDMKNVPECANSTVCLSNGTVYYSFGQYNKYTNPFFYLDKQTVLVIFNKGKNYSQCPYDASGTTLSLTFGPGLDWEYFSNKSDATLQVLDIEPSTFDGCLVLISVNYSGAHATPISNYLNSTNDDDWSDEGTGIVWIDLRVTLGLVVIMIVIVTLYLIIGTAINVAGGRSGCLEMLPQYNILSWREFLASVVERITFGQCSRNADHAHFPNYDKPRH